MWHGMFLVISGAYINDATKLQNGRFSIFRSNLFDIFSMVQVIDYDNR